jgi:hypothetical protein
MKLWMDSAGWRYGLVAGFLENDNDLSGFIIGCEYFDQLRIS